MLLFPAFGNATTYTVTAGGGGNSFSPASFTMALGDTVLWVIASGTHNTLSTAVPSGALNWSSGSMSGSATFIYVPTVTGTYFYECSFHLNMTGQFVVGGCTGPATPSVASSNGTSACAGGSPIALSTGTQSGASYQWYNGTSAISGATMSSFSAPVTSAGISSYSVKVSRCNTSLTSSPVSITVNALPLTSFSISGSGLTKTFTNTTPGTGMTYSWDFGDGTPASTLVSPTHTYATTGAKTVKLTATTTSTACSKVAQQTVSVALGVATINAHDLAVITPNPASTVINVRSLGEKPSVILTDFAGRKVNVPVFAHGREIQIDIQAIPAGIYFLRMTASGGSAVEKITVVH